MSENDFGIGEVGEILWQHPAGPSLVVLAAGIAFVLADVPIIGWGILGGAGYNLGRLALRRFLSSRRKGPNDD